MSTKALRAVLKRTPCTGSLGPCDHCDALAEVEAIERAAKDMESNGIIETMTHDGLNHASSTVESIARDAP